MASALKAATLYFAIVFAAGFALGTLRVLAVIPVIGELAAVALEVPVILAVSWFVCRRLAMRFSVPPETGPRMAMGALAFGFLMLAEFALSIFLFGRSGAAYFALLQTPPGLLGLAGQIAFALLPIIQLKKEFNVL